MKIGLVAFRYHAGVLQMYLELCAAAGVDVVLFTSERLLRDLRQYFVGEQVPATRIVLNTGMSDAAFLLHMGGEVSGLDALVFVELQFDAREDWNSFRQLSLRYPVYAGIHDIVLEPGLEFIPWRRMIEKSAAKLRKRAFASVQRFVVHAPQMRERFSREVAPRKVGFVPVYFRDRSFRRMPGAGSGPLRICVPGSYTETRRDYALVLNVIARILDGGCPVQAKLVGHPAHCGRAAMLARLEAFAARYPGVLTWSKVYTEEGAYRSALETSDLMLAPLVHPPPINERWSFTGETRRVYALDRHITAATYDAVRFQLPILYPSFYMPASAQHPGALTYETEEDLAEQIVALSKDREALATLTNDAIRHAESFTPEKFAPEFKAFLMP